MNIYIDFEYPTHFPWLQPLVEKELGDVLRRAAEGQLAAYGRQYVLEDAIASGKSFKAFDISDVASSGDRMEINLTPQGDRAEVIGYIEYGRGPGRMPPRQAIIDWMIARKIIKKDEKGRRVEALSFAIAKTIAEDGIEPRFILEKAERHYRPYIERMFEAAIRRLSTKISERLAQEEG